MCVRDIIWGYKGGTAHWHHGAGVRGCDSRGYKVGGVHTVLLIVGDIVWIEIPFGLMIWVFLLGWIWDFVMGLNWDFIFIKLRLLIGILRFLLSWNFWQLRSLYCLKWWYWFWLVNCDFNTFVLRFHDVETSIWFKVVIWVKCSFVIFVGLL